MEGDKKQTQQPDAKESLSSLGQGQKWNDPGGQGHDSEDEVIPEWSCFMKTVNNTALMLVFVPASFDDLVLLNEKAQAEEDEKIMEAKDDSTKVTDQTSEELCVKDDSLIKSETEFSDKTSECVTAESHLDAATPTKTISENGIDKKQDLGDDFANENIHVEAREDMTESHDAAVENLADDQIGEIPKKEDDKADSQKKQASKPLILPVYIYDCIIHNVLDSLINPWDFQLPSDTYQDLTFDFQEEPQELGGRIKRVSFSIDNLKVKLYVTFSTQIQQMTFCIFIHICPTKIRL